MTALAFGSGESFSTRSRNRQEEARGSAVTPCACERAFGRPSERQPAGEQHRGPFRAPPASTHGPFKGPSSYHRLCRWSLITALSLIWAARVVCIVYVR